MLHGRIPGSRRSCCFAAKTGRTGSDADQTDLQQIVASGSGQKPSLLADTETIEFFPAFDLYLLHTGTEHLVGV